VNAVPKEPPTVSVGKLLPIAVGRYPDRDGVTRLLPYSAAELERAIETYRRRLGTFHFRTGDHLLVTSLFDESAQFMPFERALSAYGLVLCSADASLFDAPRTETILRRFDVVAVLGATASLLDGLVAQGLDPQKLFAGRVVWARPDAYARLEHCSAIKLHRWMEIGPAFAVECAAGAGAHLDRLEWDVETDNGEMVLTNRLDRALNFKAYRTGVHATIERHTCACGSADPRLRPVPQEPV
jgi:phenylacetate-coenzyme A ligase PaaK-like adenylate-forming protein